MGPLDDFFKSSIAIFRLRLATLKTITTTKIENPDSRFSWVVGSIQVLAGFQELTNLNSLLHSPHSSPIWSHLELTGPEMILFSVQDLNNLKSLNEILLLPSLLSFSFFFPLPLPLFSLSHYLSFSHDRNTSR